MNWRKVLDDGYTVDFSKCDPTLPPDELALCGWPERGSVFFLDNFPVHADGECRVLDQFGRWRRKGLREARL